MWGSHSVTKDMDKFKKKYFESNSLSLRNMGEHDVSSYLKFDISFQKIFYFFLPIFLFFFFLFFQFIQTEKCF
jgi:hypothetical protein